MYWEPQCDLQTGFCVRFFSLCLDCQASNNSKAVLSCKWLPCCISFSLMDFLRASELLSSVEKFWSSWKFKSPLLPLFSSEGWWSCRGSRPRAGVRSCSLEKQYGFLSSLCLSLAITVCHATERRGCALPSLSCIPPSCHSLTHTLHFRQKTCHPPLLNWC